MEGYVNGGYVSYPPFTYPQKGALYEMEYVKGGYVNGGYVNGGYGNGGYVDGGVCKWRGM